MEVTADRPVEGPPGYRIATIDDIARKLKDNKDRGRKAALLLGAGASRSAGIALAGEIVEQHFTRYAGAFPEFSAESLPDYPTFMDRLDHSQRTDVLDRYLRDAKINAAHLYAACLVKHGYVDWILTTNFDPLSERGLVYANLSHYVYDVVNLSHIRPGQITSPAVLYLHGQAGAFRTVHSLEEDKDLRPRLDDILREVLATRTLLVVGYGGESDPVFDILCKFGQFPNSLYWTYHRDADPTELVLDRLLSNSTNFAYYTRGQDADLFFMRLAKALGIDSSSVTAKPFTFLREALEQVAVVRDETTEADLADVAKKWAIMTVDCFENRVRACPRDAEREQVERDAVTKQAREAWAEGRFDGLDQLLADATRLKAEEAFEPLASAYTASGTKLAACARLQTGDEAEATFRDACGRYQRATEIKPNKHEAFNNWGVALKDLARLQTDDEAKTTLRDACAKYQRATEIKPNKHEAFNNWGVALKDLARLQTDDEAKTTLRDASAKYQRAAEIKPDYYGAFYNWGLTLADMAEIQTGDEAKATLRDACAKYQRATEIKPVHAGLFSTWGYALTDLARLQSGEEAKATFRDACAKHKRATEIRPDKPEAFVSWGNALVRLAQLQSGPEAIASLKEAIAKFQQATAIMPDEHAVFDTWGYALACLHRTVDEGQRAAVLDEAERVLMLGNELKPGACDYNLACVAALKSEADRAFDLLEDVLAKDGSAMGKVKQDDDFGGLHDDPRWLQLLEKYNKNPASPPERNPGAAETK